MLLYMYEIFSSLLGHLHFFVHFSLSFMEQFFFGHPIYVLQKTCCMSKHNDFFLIFDQLFKLCIKRSMV